MIRIPSNVLAFAGEANLDVYTMFADYWNHYCATVMGANKEYQTEGANAQGQMVKVSFSEKEDQMNEALRKEITRVAGVSDMSQFPVSTWASHPVLQWASFAVVSAMIDMILPQTIIDSIGLYSEVRNIGWGDSALFDVEPRDLFAVSKAGKGKRMAEMKKQYRGQVAILPELREMTVAVSLFKVLAGKESLADLVAKMIRSLETQVTVDVYGAFATAMSALPNTASTGLRVAGYSQAEFLRLCQEVQAWNNGAQPVAVGTKAALGNILPSNSNYRFDIASDYTRLGHMSNFLGVSLLEIPQVADWTTPFGLKIANDRIWILAPQAGKFVKLVLEGSTLAHTDEIFKNANLMQASTIMKSWGIGIATSAIAACITL